MEGPAVVVSEHRNNNDDANPLDPRTNQCAVTDAYRAF
jgi:hypothetical protein